MRRKCEAAVIGLYARVRIVTNAYVERGVAAGVLGYVIERRGETKWEVEFSDATTGITWAQLVVDESEIVVEPERHDA